MTPLDLRGPDDDPVPIGEPDEDEGYDDDDEEDDGDEDEDAGGSRRLSMFMEARNTPSASATTTMMHTE